MSSLLSSQAQSIVESDTTTIGIHVLYSSDILNSQISGHLVYTLTRIPVLDTISNKPDVR